MQLALVEKRWKMQSQEIPIKVLYLWDILNEQFVNVLGATFNYKYTGKICWYIFEINSTWEIQRIKHIITGI